jgi:enediyne biosynthesis protein E4
LFGNHSDNRLKIGSIDANTGCLLKGNGKGDFEYVSQVVSGLNVKGDVKSVEEVMINGKKHLVIGIADESIKMYMER